MFYFILVIAGWFKNNCHLKLQALQGHSHSSSQRTVAKARCLEFCAKSFLLYVAMTLLLLMLLLLVVVVVVGCCCCCWLLVVVVGVVVSCCCCCCCCCCWLLVVQL